MRDGQEFLDEDAPNQHITSWSGSQTSSELGSPSPDRRQLQVLEEDKDHFGLEQNAYRIARQGGGKKSNEFEFKLDDEITREFRPKKAGKKLDF